MIFENTPTIFTDRLVLRKFTLADAKDMFVILSHAETNTFLPWLAHKNIQETQDFLQKQYLDSYSAKAGYRYAVCLKETDEPIGYMSLANNAGKDLGYCIKKDFWHKGIGTEAGLAIVERIKNAGYDFITATHDVHNPNSGKIMQNIGMTYKYTYIERVQPKNIEVAFRMYQLNFNSQDMQTYTEYWDKYENHYIEENL